MFWQQRLILACLLHAVTAAALDLRRAVIVTGADATKVEKNAAAMLAGEIEKRTGIRMDVSTAWPGAARPGIGLGRADVLRELAGSRAQQLPSQPGGGAEGFRIQAAPGAVLVAGNDERGVLFGTGALLRNLSMDRGRLELRDDFRLTTAPRYALRGHQLGYRPKVNTYDGWTVANYEQYIRDLAVFGTNAIEMIPPRSDDDDDSPHFTLSKIDMLAAVSKLLDDYGLDFWLWYPAMDKDYSDPATVEFALKEWGDVFRKLPRLDAVAVPGGYPGHTQPKFLMPLLEKQAKQLRQYHPRAAMWVSAQSFNAAWLEEFFQILDQEPAWLTGVVFGPQTRISLPELRARTPKRYPIRRYPDITHSRHCQYPVPDWDLAFAVTEGREVINPRPRDMSRIFQLFEKHAVGFLTYSEGVNDDVNKILWSALGWNPDAAVIDILREYGRYFIGERHADEFAHGLLALEQNWRGPLPANTGVETTLRQLQAMERAASPRMLLNWRFQQALYRAYYDAYLRSRLLHESAVEDAALAKLRAVERLGPAEAMRQAEAILAESEREPMAQDLRARVFELAEALYQSIHMQLSVPKYKAIGAERGANLDLIDMPLNNRMFLRKRFAELRQLPDADQRNGLREMVDWKNPGPGGFYDDLGNPSAEPHLVRGPGFREDPAHLQSALTGFAVRGHGISTQVNFLEYPISWWHHAEALNDSTLRMHYTDLDPSAQYVLRVVYGGDTVTPKIRLAANDAIEIHPLIGRPVPFRPLEFEIPKPATAGGELRLTFSKEPGLGGAGRGLQVAEVWLRKK